MLGVSQCDLHTATSNQHSSRSPEVAAGSVAGIHPNQRHPRGAVDRISPSRELKGRVRETYDVDFTEGPPSANLGGGSQNFLRGAPPHTPLGLPPQTLPGALPQTPLELPPQTPSVPP